MALVLEKRALSELRAKANPKGRINVQTLREAYGQLIDTASGCLGIMEQLYESNDYSPSDPLFHTLDELFCLKMERLPKRKSKHLRTVGKTAQLRVEEELVGRYSSLTKKLDCINQEIYSQTSPPEESEADLPCDESLEPSDAELRKLEAEAREG